MGAAAPFGFQNYSINQFNRLAVSPVSESINLSGQRSSGVSRSPPLLCVLSFVQFELARPPLDPLLPW